MEFFPNAEHALIPLFWQHADDHAVLSEEMRRMRSAGIRDCIVEPRPHPDYLGAGWWRDLDHILSEAEKLDMGVWLFDDGGYPSGFAGGELARRYPQHTKRYWAECHMDAAGPLPHAHFLIDDWLAAGEELLAVVAARRTDGENELDADTLTDLTAQVAGGRLYWAAPDGDWRVFVLKITPHGLEEHTNCYVNPLDKQAVGKYIELVHERHYAHYGPLFGSRIRGFFTDEPRFGNIPGYDCVVGSRAMPLPCCAGLLEELDAAPTGKFLPLLPLLWYCDRQGRCADVRYVYMDAVSRRFAENFTGQLGDWCRAHGVRLIGHVVEENGAHARLGYGAGHYFRAMQGLDAAGIDVVNNLLPGHTDGSYATMFNTYDCDFNHWGLAKMASSAAHADPKKQGHALCEAFGAYGWFEGLKLMKWITDHLAVQGVDLLTPHAFSPAPFPDPECPPHFYARGQNPQFRYFPLWATYAKRLSGMLGGAAHVAPVAVVYHAEAEWGGACEPFEKAVKVLSQHQLDCDVVCIDTLLASTVTGGQLAVGGERFRALVVPYAEFLPPTFAKKLTAFAAAGLPVLFTRALPKRCYFGAPVAIPGARAVPTAALARELAAYADIRLAADCPDLLYAHYRRSGQDVYLFVNQSTQKAVDTTVTFADTRPALLYDALADCRWQPPQRVEGPHSVLPLHLDAWQSRAVVFGCETAGLPPLPKPPVTADWQVWADGWQIETATAAEYPAFRPTPFTATGDLSRPGYLPDFAGTVRYRRSFMLKAPYPLLLDLGEAGEVVSVLVNGCRRADLICPPYRLVLDAAWLQAGENTLAIEVTNTVVKACHSDPYDRFFVQDPTGLADPVTVKKIVEE